MPDGEYEIGLRETVSWSAFVEVSPFENRAAVNSRSNSSDLFLTATNEKEDDEQEGVDIGTSNGNDLDNDACAGAVVGGKVYTDGSDNHAVVEPIYSGRGPEFRKRRTQEGELVEIKTSTVLRDTLQYSKIYAASKLVERDSNKRISSTWHPRYEKVVYMLDKGALQEASLRYATHDSLSKILL